MRGKLAHSAEVAGGIDEAATEVILPNAVDDGPPGERVFLVGNPLGEGGTAVSFFVIRRKCEARVHATDNRNCARSDEPIRPLDVAAKENVYLPRLAASCSGANERAVAGVDSAGIDELLRREGANALLSFLDGRGDF